MMMPIKYAYCSTTNRRHLVVSIRRIVSSFVIIICLCLCQQVSPTDIANYSSSANDSETNEQQSNTAVTDATPSAIVFPSSKAAGDNKSMKNNHETNKNNKIHKITATTATKDDEPIRILYIMTTLREFNNGRRATKRGSDRIQQTVMPVLRESVNSMVQEPYNYHVDVYLILGYELKQSRIQEIQTVLPPQTNLRIWNDATQYAYDIGGPEKLHSQLSEINRLLSRQHRFIVRDELLNYDMFVVFEDDMIIKGEQVHNYMKMSNEIFRLRDKVKQERISKKKQDSVFNGKFYGEMNEAQLSRTIPGFVRVEALLDEETYKTQELLSTVPVDLMFPVKKDKIVNSSTTSKIRPQKNMTSYARKVVNPEICCRVNSTELFQNGSIPLQPTSDQLFMWETAIEALGVREMPYNSSLGWVMLQRGPLEHLTIRRGRAASFYDDYWAGNAAQKDTKRPPLVRPNPIEPKYINNQGGWMATQQQLFEWDTDQCTGSFLPPFDTPTYQFDGLDRRNVEYYSGGLQLAETKNSCGLQRIVSLDPDEFSKQLLYHSSNNKQRSHQDKRDRFVRINHFLGQLNTARKHATQAKANEIEQKKKKSWFSS